jgi:NADH-quinone oxidoreductase subunit E
MAVRRLHSDQPPNFAFTAENLAWAKETIAKYPLGKEASAVLPVLWRAQEQHDGWLPEPAIRYVADMLGMAYIRVLEVATFYTMFQLAPVGKTAHVQVCGTTPCMLRGAEDLIKVCKAKINVEPHHLSADGNFSWEEVECLGSCANAPMVQIFKDTYEDLTSDLFEKLLEGFANGNPPKPGSQSGRTASCPEGGPTTLSDPALFDGSTIGAWKQRFAAVAGADHKQQDVAKAKAGSVANVETTAEATEKTGGDGKPGAPGAAEGYASKPEAHAASGGDEPPGRPSMGAAGLLAVGGAATGVAAQVAKDNLVAEAAAGAVTAALGGAASGSAAGASTDEAGATDAVGKKPVLLSAPRDGKGDDLRLMWGVAEKLQEKLNQMGIWHFDQIAKWTPDEVEWFEASMQGFKGRVERDKWIEQCQKLAEGWRPDNAAGERPKR